MHQFDVSFQDRFSLKLEQRFRNVCRPGVGPCSFTGRGDDSYFNFFHWGIRYFYRPGNVKNDTGIRTL
ncbi:hypothetical protein LEP1GSC060_3431 [Leptospira weilii serovar Ranarum str. ICFT]|uniref:Uncharacterized protein n=1 Tax=Leptospira weilii serovar Ranarum str. ICFT TaxID=1218598 RepID=N1WLY3_9LEPT|nr:hypothetical protein LEP1GSC060_3431 [Leptospira weilii serovar Ranarum str. ICFT]